MARQHQSRQSPARPGTQPLEQRRQQIEQVEQLSGGVFRCAYFFAVTGAGEKRVSINFPVRYPTMPACSHGASLEPGSVIEEGNAPHGAATVIDWKFDGQNQYIGADVFLIMYGADDQDAVIHFQVEGKALQAPFPEE